MVSMPTLIIVMHGLELWPRSRGSNLFQSCVISLRGEAWSMLSPYSIALLQWQCGQAKARKIRKKAGVSPAGAAGQKKGEVREYLLALPRLSCCAQRGHVERAWITCLPAGHRIDPVDLHEAPALPERPRGLVGAVAG